MTWIRSSACSMGTCVEVRHVDGHVEVRDNTAPDTVLHITPADWAAFLVGAKAGEFDGPAADGKRTPGEIDDEHYAQVSAYVCGEVDTSPYGTVPECQGSCRHCGAAEDEYCEPGCPCEQGGS